MPTQAELGRRIALIVASTDYRDPTLQQLRAPGHDASDLTEVLRDPAIGTFEVRTLINAPSDQMLRGIAQFCQQAGPRDLVLVYLSCHGVLDSRGRLHYATVDTERALLSATAMSAGWLNDQFDDCRARRQILMLDCCHSGAFAKGSKGDSALALKERFSGRGKVVLTASGATEYSFEGTDVVGEGIRSVFTRAVVDGLRTGEADRDKDGLVTVNDLYHHVYDTVRAAEPRQTPELWTFAAEGDLLVAHSPKGTPLPEDVRLLIESPRLVVRESGLKVLADLADHGEPGLALTARLTLQRISEDDLPRIAVLARAAYDADHGRAVAQLEAQERARREAEEQARRQQAERAAAQRQQEIEQLRAQMRGHATAEDWDAVLAVSDQLAALDPGAADPDALASTAREQITRRQQAERAAAQRQQEIEQLRAQMRGHATAEDWDAVLAVSDQLAALDPGAADPDALASTAREQITRRQQAERAAAQRQQEIEQLRAQMRGHATAEDWDAVLAVSDQLAALDPGAADPDALASTAREQITRRQQAERAAAQRQQEIEQLRAQMRGHATAEDWDAVLAVSDQLAALDPGAADPDALASTAREQITRRQQAERAAAQRQQQIDQLRAQMRGHATAEDWDAVLAVSDQLTALDPGAADPDALASTAREQITRRQQAERADNGAPDVVDDRAAERLSSIPSGVRGGKFFGPNVTRRSVIIGMISVPVAAGIATAGWELSQDNATVSHPPGRLSQQPTPEPTSLVQHPGAKIWSFQAPGPVNAGPVVANNVVYAANDSTGGPASHNVYAFHAVSGSSIWKFANAGETYSGIAVANGLVYIGSDFHNVDAFRTVDGTLAWRFVTGDLVFSTPAVANGVVYAGSVDQKVYALNAATGHEIWSYTTAGNVDSGLTVADNTVYAASTDGYVHALRAASGEQIWSFAIGGVPRTDVATANSSVYVGSNDKNVYALDATTGQKRWNYATGGSVQSGIAVDGGVVYVGSNDKNVYALDATTGQKRWNYATGGSVQSGIAVDGGVVYVGSNDKNMYALDATTGQKRWNYATGGSVQSGIAVAAQGIVYAGSTDGKLYAVRA